ncbi:MAG: DUF4956 domain-containing protein [Clostridium sp.]|uniref:DUF4956 domain-containing protein n=1 Tax=Clostridium sp. TaxID=1506 RepID=UPI002A8908EE|nr:DUF4956 domain-containing protein [Clostridium sp.]MDY5098834.1 DUF4956 domain-containing protein [Clostridium sp.]
MLNTIFKGIFDSATTVVIPVTDFLICLGVSIVIGLILVYAYTFKSRYTKGFAVTLALIPAVVCVIIMMVNGNVGTGVAVAGAFSLVRFRSAPGSAREICAIFLAMGTGLVAGMGYLAYAVLLAVILGGMLMLYSMSGFEKRSKYSNEKVLRITIPEDLDYTDVFDDILNEYAESYEIVSVKTSNMGSLFKIKYNIVLKDTSKEKEFIDNLRCRNGNLEISMSMQEVNMNSL